MNSRLKSIVLVFSIAAISCNGNNSGNGGGTDMAMGGGAGAGGMGGGGAGAGGMGGGTGGGAGSMGGAGMGGSGGGTPDMGPGNDMTLPPDNSPDLTKLVDPFLGTGLAPVSSAPVDGGGGGSVFPGAVVPWGMVQFSPDTPNGSPSGYMFGDTSTSGFSLTHFSGAGCPNNGDLPILPLLDATATSLPFNHSGESAAPGYYAVTSTNGIKSELTATLRTGFARFTFPAGHDPVIVLDASRNNTANPTPNQVVLAGSDGVRGYTVGGLFCGGATFPIYFEAKFDRPFKSSSLVNGKTTLTFDGAKGATVQLKIGLSFYNQAGSALNLSSENSGFDFDLVREQARRQWNLRLHAIDITGGSTDDQTKFYSALYHTLMHPNVYSDVDGHFPGFDGVSHQAAAGHAQYANFSGWDIYRSEIQIEALLFPDITSDIIQSLVNDAQQCGAFPKWSQNNVEDNVMSGDPGALIVANGWAFGAKSFDTKGALDIMRFMSYRDSRCGNHTEFDDLGDYNGVGFGSFNSVQASYTLEYTARDAAVSQFAQAIGDSDLARFTRARSAQWRNLLHPTAMLIEPRYSNGAWVNPLYTAGQGFNSGYQEGNAEQYTWFVPHDGRGLYQALGGNAAVVTRLDSFFTQLNAGQSNPNFYMGNEPSFNDPFLYDFFNAPWRTQDVVNRIINSAFGLGASGLPGNDDLGATSSWLVFAMLGGFPQLPGVGGLALGSPTFPSAAIHLQNGKTFTISATGSGHYVQSATLNGSATTNLWLPIDTIQAGGTLAFTLGAAANTSWGQNDTDMPPSMGPGSFASVNDAVNNDGVTADGAAHDSSFDGYGWNYSQSELNKSVPNGSFTYTDSANGVTVTFPFASGSSALDNMITVGQTITFTPAKVRYIALLGTSSGGNATGDFVPRYAEGAQATDKVSVTFSDWTLGGNPNGTPVGGNQKAIVTGYRNYSNGAAQSIATNIFYDLVKVDATRTLTGVTLPGQVTSGRMHLFSVVAVP